MKHSPFDATISALSKAILSFSVEFLVKLRRCVTELLILEIWVVFPDLPAPNELIIEQEIHI